MLQPLLFYWNNTPPKRTIKQNLTVPCEIVGQFYPADDRDWYSFEAKKGDVYWIEIFSQRLGIPSDPFVLVQRVTKNDKGVEQVSDIKELSDSDANFGGAEYKTEFAWIRPGGFRLRKPAPIACKCVTSLVVPNPTLGWFIDCRFARSPLTSG